MPVRGADAWLLDPDGRPNGSRVQRFAEAVRDLLAERDSRRGWSSAPISWPGGSPLSNVIVVNHRLPVTPGIAQAIADSPDVNVGWVSVSATQLGFRARHLTSSPAAGTLGALWWRAEV